MEKITLHDKSFRICIPNEQIEESIRKVAEQINNDYKDVECPLFLAVLNGSFMFTASLLKHINFECEISFVRLSSYCGTSSTGEVKQILGFNKSLEGRSVIVVEDIVDSGETMVEMNKTLLSANVKDARICTLLFKKGHFRIFVVRDISLVLLTHSFYAGSWRPLGWLRQTLRPLSPLPFS